MIDHSAAGAFRLYCTIISCCLVLYACLTHTVPPAATLHLEVAKPWLALPRLAVSEIRCIFDMNLTPNIRAGYIRNGGVARWQPCTCTLVLYRQSR